MMKEITVVHAIIAYPEDIRRWKSLIRYYKPSNVLIKGEIARTGEIKPGGRLGIRMYLRDKNRWSKIVKKAAIDNKSAADVFKEMLDLLERRRHNLKNKKAADIFKYLLNLYERELLLYG